VIVVDTSAIIAVFKHEPDADIYFNHICKAAHTYFSAASYAEASIVVTGQLGESALLQLDALITQLGIKIEPLTQDHAKLARDGFARFGKGRGGKAQLNMGDCFSYALARAMNLPLLFKGKDFIGTDLNLLLE
jgi:ribonuclease VapC